MSISELMPWRKQETDLVDRQQTEDGLLDLRGQRSRMFEDFYHTSFGISPFLEEFQSLSDFSPRMDIKESAKEIAVTAELPGIKPEDLEISIGNKLLTISGEKREEKEDTGKGHNRVERSYGSFTRRVPLPTEVEEDQVEASLQEGLLKITLPKDKTARKNAKHMPVKTD